MVRAMCGKQLRDMKRVKDLMLMFGLNEPMSFMAMAMSVLV